MNLVDTTVAVDHLRGRPDATRLLERLVNDGCVLAASELMRFELLAGARPAELQMLEVFFGTMLWVPADEQVTRIAGRLANRYRASFSGIGAADYLIAATSILLDAPLLTTNVRHFPMFSDLVPAY